MITASYIDAVSLPRLVRPAPQEAPNLVAAVFDYMKRVPAQFCVERALDPVLRQTLGRDGMFSPADAGGDVPAAIVAEKDGMQTFIETSSGNMATGLAEICHERNVHLHLLLPRMVDDGTKSYIRSLGATIEEIDTSDQAARVARLHELQADYTARGWDVTWVAQYENRNNPLSYYRVAQLLVSELDTVATLVGAVGTGGSTGGTAEFLRRAGFPDLRLVGADAGGSVNFAHKASDFLLGGLGSTRTMPLVDRRAYDIVHWFDDNTAFGYALELFAKGIPVGGSSGAAFAAARYEAMARPEDLVVVIFPDHARRYEQTIMAKSWRDEHAVDVTQAKQAPKEVKVPAEADPSEVGVERGWYRIDWRSYWSTQATDA